MTSAHVHKKLSQQDISMQIDLLKKIKETLVDDAYHKEMDGIDWACAQFEEYFNHNIRKLIRNFPQDTISYLLSLDDFIYLVVMELHFGVEQSCFHFQLL